MADGERKDDNIADLIKPTYLYDAMKEKRKLKPLLDGEQQDTEVFLCLYLNALDEELPAVLASISVHQGRRGDSVWPGHWVRWEVKVSWPISRDTYHAYSGEVRSPVRAPNQPDVGLTEDWRSLHLDIQPVSVLAVEDALMRVCQSRPMQDGLSGFRYARQQMLISALPPVLVLISSVTDTMQLRTV
ncbi:hypothetical protein BGY98DRAFT_1160961 [Russula aff. rugulosa BPL654]|nr:hypothetical protein BGY98DRAFT_1160961 [Russula aff. rugulosa BPL654]